MTGTGTVDLPGKGLKFRVDPQVVASLEGQGGKTGLAGLGVPVMIAGPWAKPSIYPDIEGILQNPQAAYEQLNKLSGGLVSIKGNALGDTGTIAGGIIQNGKINKKALEQGAINGLGALLGGKKGKQAPAAVAAEPSGQPAEQAPTDDQQPADAETLPEQPKAKQNQSKAKQGALSDDAGSMVKKKGKKKQEAENANSHPNAQQDPALAPEAAARQLMQNFFGN